MVKFTKLPWDSDFFGFEVAKLDLLPTDNVEAFFEQGKPSYKLLYVFTKNVISEKVLNENNGRLVDKKVILEKSIGKNFVTLKIEEYNEDIISEQLRMLVYASGIYSRYKLDDRLPENSFKRLYNIWIEQSVLGSLADKVFVYRKSSLIVGFITVKIKNNVGEIGLIAIDKKNRGQSIGKHLIYKVESYLQEINIKKLIVATQKDNNAALSFYDNLDFKIIETNLVYHFISETDLNS